MFNKDAPNTDYNFTEEKPTPQQDDRLKLNYIPEGFVLNDTNETSESITLIFTKEKLYFQASMESIDINFGIDTENATVEKLKINGCEAMYISNPNINAIIWHDNNYAYSIFGNITKNDIIKIAENTKADF